MKKILQGLYDFVINKALGLILNKYLKGSKTVVVNTAMLVLALWEMLSGGQLFEMLCEFSDTLGFLAFTCDIENSKVWTAIIGIMAALNNVLRQITNTPVGVSNAPAELSIGGYEPPIGHVVIGIASVASLVYFVIAII